MSGYLLDLPAAPSAQSSVPLVVGLGNPMCGDDSVGIELVQSLRDDQRFLCDFLEVSSSRLDLLDLCDRQRSILFVDAVVSGAAPGTIHLIPLPSTAVESRSVAFVSTHGFGLSEVIDLRRALGYPVPRMMLLGIEIESVTQGAARSKGVEQALRTAKSNFAHLLRLFDEQESILWKEPHRVSAANFGPAGCSETGLENEQPSRTT